MKVIEICSLPNYGGTKTCVSNLIDVFLKQNLEVVLLGSDGGISREIDHGSFRYIRVRARGKQAIFLAGLFVRLMIMRHLNREPDIIVHTHLLDEALLASLVLNRCHIVCTLHGKKLLSVQQNHSKVKARLYEFIEGQSIRRLLKRRSVIVAVDDSTRDHYYRRYCWAEGKILTIPVGVDLQLFRPLDRNMSRQRYGFDRDEHIVMYIGRLAPEKNLLFLVKAFHILRRDRTNIRLVLVGVGEERENIEHALSQLGLHDSVLFYGEVEYTSMPGLINCADVVVLCSHYEGSPHVIREAVACKVPIVTTDVGDVMEVIEDYGIGYVSMYDEEEFSSNIARAIREMEQPKAMKADEIKRTISADSMAENYLLIFQSMKYK